MIKEVQRGAWAVLSLKWLVGAGSLVAIGCSGRALPDGADRVAATQTEQAVTVAGTWTPLPFNTITNTSNEIVSLLTDGSLLVQSAGDWHSWSKFTPDAGGNYATGSWSAAARSSSGRLYFPYAVLRDGRLFIAGGEYLSSGETDHAAAEIFNPLTNSWTSVPDSPLGDIGDVPNQVLPDGRIVMGYRFGNSVELFDSTTSSWSAAASKASGSGTEETWSLLPAGTVLNWAATQPQLYIPASNQWVTAAQPPVVMQNPSDLETGPAVFMPNGQLVAFGAFGNLALYTPGASPADPGAWILGPSAPPPTQANSNPNGTQYTEDVPACLEPNGKVLFVSSDTVFGFGNFSEYDPVSNTVTPIQGPAISAGQPSYTLQFVSLPTGQILVTGTGTNDYLYTPTGAPLDAWRPTIASVSANADGSFTLSGTQLNGLSQGASYGDEGNAQTNFPLVRLSSGSSVSYARTFGFSTMGIATGNAVTQTQFTLPPGISAGAYQLTVVTNGVASAPFPFTVNQGQNQPPSVSLTAPANNSSFSAPAQITLTASASDADGTVSKVEFYQGSTLLGTSTTAPYSFNWLNVAAGAYSLSSKAYDNLNAVTTSAAVNVTVNTVANNPPIVSVTSPANNASFNAPAQITITASASDTDGTISKVEFYQGNTLLGTSTTAPYSFNWLNVAAGAYSLSSKAYDNLNAVTTSAAVNVTVNTVANNPPIVSVTSPANNASFNAPAQIAITASASDTDGTISKVEFYQGTTLLGTDTTSPYSFSWANVAAGSYVLTVKGYDNSNAVTTSTVVNVVVNSSTGTNPCATLCTNPLVFTGPNYQSGNLGTGAVCRETKSVLHAGNCSNISGRTLKVNGVTMSCNLWTLPAPRNGGYCVQVTAGTPDWTSFATW